MNKNNDKILQKFKNDEGMIIGLIGDEDFCLGFVLAGIGESDDQTGITNVLITNKKTETEDIRTFFIDLMNRKNIAIIFISLDIANDIRKTIDKYSPQVLPTIVEIPFNNPLYAVCNDQLLIKAVLNRL